jgi:hypothetical protein
MYRISEKIIDFLSIPSINIVLEAFWPLFLCIPFIFCLYVVYSIFW